MVWLNRLSSFEELKLLSRFCCTLYIAIFVFLFQYFHRHYAGDVVYNINGFLAKNKDTFFQDFKRLMHLSQDPLISGIWPDGAQDITMTTKRPLTAGTMFKNSMIALVNNLTRKEPYYVRCVKPNDQKIPIMFDQELVVHQVQPKICIFKVLKLEGYFDISLPYFLIEVTNMHKKYTSMV